MNLRIINLKKRKRKINEVISICGSKVGFFSLCKYLDLYFVNRVYGVYFIIQLKQIKVKELRVYSDSNHKLFMKLPVNCKMVENKAQQTDSIFFG